MATRTAASTIALLSALTAIAPSSPAAATGSGDGGALSVAPYARWESFGEKDGLPSGLVFAVRVDGDRVWAGTRNGLALYEKGRWRSWGAEEGLPHPAVLALDVSPRTGDLWIGTMGGLARFSAGRFDRFTQLDSGLSNDFVHAVHADPSEDVIWVGTAMGASRLDLRTNEWTIFTHENAPFHEPWIYSIATAGDRVWVGAWGAGVLEYTSTTGRWREYRDPDGQFEVDLFPDDGPINDVTSGVDTSEGILWQSTYVGLARYDGREWSSFTIDDSGLASDFINFVRARGRLAWLATDNGLSVTDGSAWQTYRGLPVGGGEVLFYREGTQAGRRALGSAPAHNYILGVDVDGDDIWLATHAGVSHGVRSGPLPLALASDAAFVKPPGKRGTPSGRFAYAGTPEELRPFREVEPHRELFRERIGFLGAGRDEPEPAGLSSVKVGFIGPLGEEDLPRRPSGLPPVEDAGKAAHGRRMLRAARLAVEEANAAGGYRGIPFEIVPRSDLVLWGQSSNELVGFAFDDGVWAVLSGFDSNNTHVLSRGVIKAEIPLVSAGSTDPTLVEHSIPWLARCINDDRQGAIVLLGEMFVRRGLERPAVLRVNDRDGRVGIMEFIEGARRMGHPVILEQRFTPGEEDFASEISKIAEAGPDSLVLWGSPEDTAMAVRQARALGLDVPVFGFDRMVDEAFLRIAGAAAEGAMLAATVNLRSTDPLWLRFRESYLGRWGEEPDAFAVHAYDGMNLILAAIGKAGLNHARIRDAIFDVRRADGASGAIVFDTNMSDIGPMWLATVREGRFAYEPAPEWPAAHGEDGRSRRSEASGGMP